MNPASNQPPALVPSNFKITLLAISPDKGDRQSLKSILDSSRWSIQEASSYREAARLISERSPSLILCERDLPDGSWKDVFREAEVLLSPPPVVVVSRKADERLWAEVLNLGGYDVLLKPFENNEVRRVMNMAVRHSSNTVSHTPQPRVA